MATQELHQQSLRSLTAAPLTLSPSFGGARESGSCQTRLFALPINPLPQTCVTWPVRKTSIATRLAC